MTMANNSFTNAPEGTVIPWKSTANIDAARNVLITMVASLGTSTPLYKFLTSQCAHLLVPPTGDTGLVVGSDGLPTTTAEDRWEVDVDNKSAVRDRLNGVSGVYLFILGSLLYFGTAANLYTRLKYHLNMSPRRAKGILLYTTMLPVRWVGAIFTPVITTPNYIEEYRTLHGPHISDQHLLILLSFTQFESRLFEQSLISFYNSGLNGAKIVVFPFMAWVPGQSLGSDGNSVMARNVETGEEFIFTSFRKGAKAFGMAETTFTRKINTGEIVVTDYGIYTLHDPADPDRLRNSQHSIANWSDVEGIDLDAVPMGVLQAICEDKVTVFGTFESPTDAMHKLDPGRTDNKYIRRRINKDSLVQVTPDKVSVYFVMNPAYMKDSKARAVANRSGRSNKAKLMKSILNIDYTGAHLSMEH